MVVKMTSQKCPSYKLKSKLILIYLIIFGFKFGQGEDIAFKFPEYEYQGTGKNEKLFHDLETACEQSIICEQLGGVERTRCAYQCISPACYHEIYDFDELEEGEVDVRLSSFKGCFLQLYRATMLST